MQPLNRFFYISAIFVSALCAVPQALQADGHLKVMTDNGLELSFDGKGRITALQSYMAVGPSGIWTYPVRIVRDRRLKPSGVLTPEAPSGIWARDAVTGKDGQFLGHLERRVRGVVFAGESKDLGLTLNATFVPEGNCIRISGCLENTTKQERGIDLEFRLYLDAAGLQWPRDVQVSGPVSAGQPVNSIYPFHGLVMPDKSDAFALAVSPEEPCMYEFTFEENAYYVLKLKYGLSRHAVGRLNQRAYFQVLLYPIDPEWGFRSVVQQYYDMHACRFKRRTTNNGSWSRPRAEQLPNPWDYGYRSVHLSNGQDFIYYEQQDVQDYEYHLPGQREFRYIPDLPETYEEKIKVLETYEQEYTRRRSPESVYDKKDLDRVLIKSSGLFDGDGRFRNLTRDTEWGGPSVTFPVNPDPDLFYDTPAVTIGKVLIEWAEWVLDKFPALEGLHIDSLFGWGRYFNCRTEHFPYAQISLTYDPESKKPAISNKFSHLEFEWALKELLDAKDRKLFANGLRPGRFFNGMELDVLSCENPVMKGLENPIMGGGVKGGGERISTGLITNQYLNLIWDRTVSYQKPYLILDHHENEWLDTEIVHTYWKVAVFFSVFPAYNYRYQTSDEFYQRDKDIINIYMPVLKQVSRAGWEPLTYARTDVSDVWIERYGDIESGLYFTLLNTSDRPHTVTISLDEEELKLKDAATVVELIKLEQPETISGNQFRCTIDGRDVKAVRIIQ